MLALLVRPLLLSVVLVLAGCGSSDVDGSGGQGFVTGDGTITTVPPADRQPPAPVRGETLQGDPVALADYRGDVLVLNVWGSWCAPCRKEAPMLADASRDLVDEGVRFLGINTRNLARADAVAFERRFEVPYPSIYDPAGEQLLSFGGTLPMSAIPTTVVLDREGRVAARVLGPITSEATFRDLVADVARRGRA